ncbi:replicative DNA helicase [Paraliobacillus sp. JSM ZJ581]|uniref:replicative DNA helicase n=1 Tax=Paraliobacillus sp. JSM ZJ581 TaxID=3342118 RepID=UPI0035A88BB2
MGQFDIAMISSDYHERMRRLALFDPLSDLERKREKDENGRMIDMKGLGLLTLLFFFEQKVIRHYKSGLKQLATFIQEVTNDRYQLQANDYYRLANILVDNFRPGTGVKRTYTFYNWEIGREEQIDYSILKTDRFNPDTTEQYYTLDEDGLELVFATKEFYSEFQLSINQLMLRKQLERGEFSGALRQINEMRVAVEGIDERMIALKQEIQRSIVSEKTFDRYKDLLDDSYQRMQREADEFKELRQFVKETKDRLYAKDIHQKEQKTYDLILTITSELEGVHYDHFRLLEQTLALKNTTLITAQESLYYTGIEAFNFDHEITSHIISVPLPVETMKGVLHPFLQVEEERIWSPLTLFAEQSLIDERQTEQSAAMLEAKGDEESDARTKALSKQYKKLMEQLLELLKEQREIRLSDFFDYLTDTNQSTLYTYRSFYDFWLIVHQRSPIARGEMENEEDGKSLLAEALYLLGDQRLFITEEKAILNRYKRYSIQEMVIRLEES